MSPNVPTRRPAVAGAVRLGRVLDDAQAVLARDRDERLHVDGRAHQVDRDHAARARADRRLDGLGGEQVRVGVDVDELRRRAGQAHRLGGGDERVRRHDDLVARADSSARSASAIASVPEETPTACARLAVGRELGLEGVDLGARA